MQDKPAFTEVRVQYASAVNNGLLGGGSASLRCAQIHRSICRTMINHYTKFTVQAEAPMTVNGDKPDPTILRYRRVFRICSRSSMFPEAIRSLLSSR